jgi:hypothetical protein
MKAEEIVNCVYDAYYDCAGVRRESLIKYLSRQIPCKMREAGLLMEWQPIETAKTLSARPLLGTANGVQFLMMWSPGSGRMNKAFREAFPDAKPVQEHEAGWYAWAAGLTCYSGRGQIIRVQPTHWMPLPPPENTHD